MQLELTNVGLRFGQAPFLFRHLSFGFHTKSTYAITGSSGSGKSSLLGIVAGWTDSTEGDVAREGIVKTSWVFQNAHGTARRSTIDHVVGPLLAAGLDRRSAEVRAGALLERFRIDYARDRLFRELSGGEAQRLMLARAIASAPDLLLVDEPTAQLDNATSREVNAVLAELAGAGHIVLIATHDSDTITACTHQLDLSTFAPGPLESAS